VQTALSATNNACQNTGRNQACYGNVRLTAEPQPGVANFGFDQQGDIVDVGRLKKLQLSAWNEAKKEWGVALMRLQANLPDTLPGQNVTLLLFGDVEIRNAVPAGDTLRRPMQAFYFRSGIGDAPCTEAPDSGILVQTPKGAHGVEIAVNEVRILLASTVYLQAQPGAQMTVSVVEGRARVEAFNVTQTVPEGARVTIPINDQLAAAGAPLQPEPYKAEDVHSMPVSVLPEQVEVASPVPSDVAFILFDIGTCESGRRENVDAIKHGDWVNVMQGWRYFDSVDEARAGLAAGGGFIAIDGQQVATYYTGPRFLETDPGGSPPAGWEIAIRTDWVAASGHHIVQGKTGDSPVHTCVLDVP
jgi:hypothetical protein